MELVEKICEKGKIEKTYKQDDYTIQTKAEMYEEINSFISSIVIKKGNEIKGVLVTTEDNIMELEKTTKKFRNEVMR